MNTYIDFVLKKPVFVLFILFIITIMLGSGIIKLKVDNSVEAMMPKEDKNYIAYQKAKKVYGNVGKMVLIGITADNIWDHAFFVEMNNMVSDFSEYMNFNETLEKQRYRRFEKATEKGNISTADLLADFKDDLVFQRYLKRKISTAFGDIELLDVKKIMALKKTLDTSYELKKQEVIVDILSPITARDISGKDDILQAVDLIEKDADGNKILPAAKVDFQIFRKNLLRNPAFRKMLYAVDDQTGQITDFSIYLEVIDNLDETLIAQEIGEITDSYKHLSVLIQGVPIVTKTINDFMNKDLGHFFPLVILVVLIVFYLNFRSARGVFLPLSAVILTDIWTLGLMGHLGITITVIGVSLPTLIIAIGSSYSIHILNQYYIDLDEISRIGKRQGLGLSMAHIAITVLLAGFTTFFGFVSLLTSEISGIREWGVFCGIGALFAVLISTSLIPAVLMLLPQNNKPQKKKGTHASTETWIDPVIRFFTNISVNHHKIVLGITCFALVVSALGLYRIKVETNFISYFKENSNIRKSIAVTEKKFNGAYGLIFLLDSGETDGITDPRFLKTIDKFRQWLVSENNPDLHVGATTAFTDIIKSMHMAMNNDDPEFYKVPDTREEVMDYLEIFSGDDDNSDGRIDDFETFVDPDFRTAMVFAKIWDKKGGVLGTSDFTLITQKTADYLTGMLPPPYSFKITGEPTIMAALSDYVVKGQLSSLLFCILAVGIIVVLLFKNIQAGLFALIPMSVAVTVNFGIMGWCGINLDTATALIASIAIGIGVDDTIHFMNTFRHFRADNISVDESISKTLAISGKAITYTSLALIFGFSVMIISNFKPIILLGTLNAVTMVGTTIGALVVLPAAIKATDASLVESESDALFWKVFYIGRIFNIETKKSILDKN